MIATASFQMKSNSISNNTPRRAAHNFARSCFVLLKTFAHCALPLAICVCFCSSSGWSWSSKLKSKTWPAVEPIETAFVYNAFELSKVQGPPVCRIKLSTLCLWLGLRDRALPLPLCRSPALCCCLSERKSFRWKLQSFENFSPRAAGAEAAETIKSVSTHLSEGYFLSQAYRITCQTRYGKATKW